MEQRNMRELLEKYKYYVIGAAVVLVVIIALVAGGRKTETVPEEPQETQEAADQQAADQQEQEEEPNELEENSHSSIERLVSKYLDCIVNGDVDALESIVDELSDADKEEVKKLDKAYDLTVT